VKVSFFNFLLLISLLSVAGCGSQGKTVSLNVTGSFSISAAGYTGGLIAYGEGPNGARFSTTSVDGSSTLTTTIDDGAWKIYVVGWESLSTPVQKFKGTKYCGMTSVNLAFSDTNINIDVNAANCSNQAFQAALGVQDVFTTSCGAFYNYAVATNTYSPLTCLIVKRSHTRSTKWLLTTFRGRLFLRESRQTVFPQVRLAEVTG